MLYERFLFPWIVRGSENDAEKAHEWTIEQLRWLQSHPSVAAVVRDHYAVTHPSLERRIAGLVFPSPVGIPAGFDKQCEVGPALFCFGPGFVTGGSVLPYFQAGNTRPRIFRLIEDGAIINRMGFNSMGRDLVWRNWADARKSPWARVSSWRRMPYGASLGKMKDTPNEHALREYVQVMETLYLFADYFDLGISSPNTPNIRKLQDPKLLRPLLRAVMARNVQLAEHYEIPRRPVFVKLAPDFESDAEFQAAVEVIREESDGLVLVNTTTKRPNLKSPHEGETGGLSGEPLAPYRRPLEQRAREIVGPGFPLMSGGGIGSVAEAKEALRWADLIFIYTGLIYHGPKLIRDINRALIN